MPSTLLLPHPRAPRPAWCLSLHAAYRCQHAGACCTAGWPIPAEPAVVQAIRLHFGRRADAAVDTTSHDEHLPLVGVTSGGACLFYDGPNGRLCAIHRDIGEPYLPSACRHFPRVVLRDLRGTFVTLSHFCPTAAALLFAAPAPRVVPAPATLTLAGMAEGLDATIALPPLLREGMLTDLEGYGTWERSCLMLVVEAGDGADDALRRISDATRVVSRWSPADGALSECVRRAFAHVATPAGSCADEPADEGLALLALRAVPADVPAPDILKEPELASVDAAEVWRRFDAVIRRYLAARLFGSWWGYLGLELSGVVAAIRVHRALLRRQLGRRLPLAEPRVALFEAIRDTDLVMVHLSDPQRLADLLRDLA